MDTPWCFVRQLNGDIKPEACQIEKVTRFAWTTLLMMLNSLKNSQFYVGIFDNLTIVFSVSVK